VKAREERKALRLAKKEAAKAETQLSEKPKLEQKQGLNSNTVYAVASEVANGRLANGIRVNGRFRDGHSRPEAANGRSVAAKPSATKAAATATAIGGERQASA